MTLTWGPNNGPTFLQITYDLTVPNASNITYRELLKQRRGLILADFPNLGQVTLQAGHQDIASNIHALVIDWQSELAAKILQRQ